MPCPPMPLKRSQENKMPGPWDSLTKRIVDTHCHVHQYSDPSKTAKEIQEQGIKVHCVTVKLSEYRKCLDLFKDHTNIIPCAGLFPLNVKEEVDKLDSFFELISETRFVGEVGLDYSIDDSTELKLQKEVFTSIVKKCDDIGNRILSIHSRRSASDVLSIIGDNFNGTAIMHWFSGEESLVKKSPDNVFYSINTAMLKSRQGKKIIKTLRPEQVLTETDGPYVKINSSPAVPQDIRNVVNSLSTLWEKSLEETLEIISENYSRAIK